MVAINFFSSKDSEETCTMYSRSENIEVMMGSETDEIIEELFDSFERGSEFVFDSVNSLYWKLHEISLNSGVWYIDSPEWLKTKKATINPKDNDDKCFQYALTVALKYQGIQKYPQRISEIKPFIDQYNWKEINFPSHKKGWKMFECIWFCS